MSSLSSTISSGSSGQLEESLFEFWLLTELTLQSIRHECSFRTNSPNSRAVMSSLNEASSSLDIWTYPNECSEAVLGEFLLENRTSITFIHDPSKLRETQNVAVRNVSQTNVKFNRKQMVRAERKKSVTSEEDKIVEVFGEGCPLTIFRGEEFSIVTSHPFWG